MEEREQELYNQIKTYISVSVANHFEGYFKILNEAERDGLLNNEISRQAKIYSDALLQINKEHNLFQTEELPTVMRAIYDTFLDITEDVQDFRNFISNLLKKVNECKE